MQGRATLLLAAGVAIAAVAAAPAEAAVTKSGGWRYVTKRYEDVGAGTKKLSAACPDRTNVYGGGHYNTGTFGHVQALHSYPYDGRDRRSRPDDGWRAHLEISTPVTAIMYAVCAKPRPRYTNQLVQAAPGLPRQEITLNCPAGTATVAGGTSGPATIPEVESYPGPLLTQWTVGVENQNATGTVFRFDSICAARSLGYSSSPDTVAAQTQGSDSAGCGDHVISGGQRNDGAALGDMVAAATRPIDFANANPDAWQTWLDNHHTSALGFTTFAICTPDVNAN
jgi:hypothetical protein